MRYRLRVPARSEPVWAVQTNLGSVETIERLHSACARLELPFAPIVAIPFSDALPELPHEPRTIVYGSANLCTNVHRSRRWSPGVFFDDERFAFEALLAHCRDQLLNADARLTTLGELAHERLDVDAELFVRPVADEKQFAGNVWHFGALRAWVDALQGDEYGVSRATRVVVSAPKPIECEWRLFVVDGEVVSGSRYRERGRSAISPDLPESVRRFGEAIAATWAPDRVFVLDVAQCEGRLCVIETNGFNSAGFYAADVLAIVRAVSDAVMTMPLRS